MRKIIGLGETVLDIIFKNDQPLKAVPGGSAFNSIISIGRTNTPCLMATEVGDDHVGDIVETFLRDNNVDTEYVYRHEGTQSHISLAFLNERNDAQYQFYKMHGALNMPPRFPEMHTGDIVIFGSFFSINPKVRDYVSEFLRCAKESGAIIYYDINFRSSHLKDLPQVMPYIEENMRMATVVRGSAEDFSILYSMDNAAEVYAKHIKPLCATFIYTDADKPVKVFTSCVQKAYEARRIETVSTIGAGDNFNAGFCYGLYVQDVDSPDAVVALTEAQLGCLIAYGQKFSSHVCQSLDNYISKEFATTLFAY